jgi:hypothetical protein
MQTIIKVGDLIKAKDFPGVENCYMVGVVTSIDEDLINAKTVKIVFDGKVKDIEAGFSDNFSTKTPGQSFTDKMGGTKFQRIEVLA